MTIRLRENNSLDAAAAWLSEQHIDLEGYQAEDILEDRCLAKIELWATVPNWQTTGEINWLKHQKIVVDSKTGEHTYTTSSASDFLLSDGRIRVTAEMAKRLLDHGECSLDCVTMPIIDCSNDQQTPLDSCLRGTRDGRLIRLEHIRVNRDELIRFVSVIDGPATEPAIARTPKLVGVNSQKIIGASWQYPPALDKEKLAGLLDNRPKWILGAMISRGRRGGESATWNPAALAIRLHDKYHFTIKGLTRVINDHFDSYLDEWNAYIEAYC